MKGSESSAKEIDLRGRSDEGGGSGGGKQGGRGLALTCSSAACRSAAVVGMMPWDPTPTGMWSKRDCASCSLTSATSDSICGEQSGFACEVLPLQLCTSENWRQRSASVPNRVGKGRRERGEAN